MSDFTSHFGTDSPQAAYFRTESPQAAYFHTYKLWESSTYYNINDLSPRNLIEPKAEDPSVSFCKTNESVPVERDSKNRRIITRTSLYEDPASKSASEVPETPPANDWTQKYWQRPGDEATMGLEQKKQPRQNKIQKTLDKALAQPVKIDKAASMMAKMGWQGGALGKSGTGIVEPIAPNATYAMNTSGFGQTDLPKQQRNAKRVTAQKKPKINKQVSKQHFKVNVLLQILEFVKNDNELELIFDKKLHNGERKTIHQLVEALMNDGKLKLQDISMYSIVDDIKRCNEYVIMTQSEGEKPDRSLCIYKEAPPFMYLVTHHDLRDDPVDTENLSQIENETVEEVIVIDDDSSEKDNESNIDIPHEEEDELKRKTKENIPTPKITEEIKINNDIITDIQATDIAVEPLIFNSKTIDHADDTSNTNSQSTDSDKSKQETNKHKRPRFAQTIEKEKNPFLKSILSVRKTDKGPSNENELYNQIIEYFSEFINEEVYTQFKFLGPFVDEEVAVISGFMEKLWMCLNEGDYMDDELMMMVNDASCGFFMQPDCNGTMVVHKVEKKPE